MSAPRSHLVRTAKRSNIILSTNEAITPPMVATRPRSYSTDSFEDEYFSKTYVPLSSLPTPPPSIHSKTSSVSHSPETLFFPGEYLDPELLGPAIHLTNLIPSSTSLTPASTPLIHAILTRAQLPLETIALAVCILDALNSRFALQWRKTCPLDAPKQNTNVNVSGSYFTQPQQQQHQHIDSISPELIPFSALILAVKFLDDAQQSTREYVDSWGRGMWSCEQVNHTQWCLMDNLCGRLLPLWDEDVILGALQDMERAAKQAAQTIVRESERLDGSPCPQKNMNLGDGSRMNCVCSVIGLGQQLTPAETPMVENIRGTNDVSDETRVAFSRSVEVVQDMFRLNNESLTEDSSVLEHHCAGMRL